MTTAEIIAQGTRVEFPRKQFGAIVIALVETIKGYPDGISAGRLYAAASSAINLYQFELAVGYLKAQEIIFEAHNILKWR